MAADPALVRAIITAGALAGGGVMMAGGAIGSGIGDGLRCSYSPHPESSQPLA
jgi:F-type H+-transporting ATPase subunit c